MEAWDAAGGCVTALHAGDLGWAMREPDGADILHSWWDGDTLAAVALEEGSVARPRTAPDRGDDTALAGQVAAVVETLDGPTLWSDAEAGTAVRAELLQRGWTSDSEDPWVALYLDLEHLPVAAEDALDADLAEQARTCVAERVEVQRRGFVGSTFTEQKWERMAAGPGYRPELDLLVRTPTGAPAAAATCWLGAAGGTAILEPVATHPDHRRRGHARRVVRAASEIARRSGATAVCVTTPARNSGAVTAYTRSGFVVVETFTALMLGQAA